MKWGSFLKKSTLFMSYHNMKKKLDLIVETNCIIFLLYTKIKCMQQA